MESLFLIRLSWLFENKRKSTTKVSVTPPVLNFLNFPSFPLEMYWCERHISLCALSFFVAADPPPVLILLPSIPSGILLLLSFVCLFVWFRPNLSVSWSFLIAPSQDCKCSIQLLPCHGIGFLKPPCHLPHLSLKVLFSFLLSFSCIIYAPHFPFFPPIRFELYRLGPINTLNPT